MMLKQQLDKYAAKMISAGLADEGAPLLGAIDADVVWNRKALKREVLEPLFEELGVNALLACRPAEPYATILDYLALTYPDAVEPSDCETKTFMHDIPVAKEFSVREISAALQRRKTVLVSGYGIVTWGRVTPEQAFVFFSSACFACFVKFFSDYLMDKRTGTVTPQQQAAFDTATRHLREIDMTRPSPGPLPLLAIGPFDNEEAIYRAVCEAGRMTVEHRLVDSFFGNVSYLNGNTLYISQTASSLDELEGCIDPCAIDGSTCAALTASSEFSAHREIAARTGMRAILHGHPRFAVILSMACDETECELRGLCHTKCKSKRFIDDIPIVPGEVGAGPGGLCHTLPPAMENHRAGIVYGHGLFTVGQKDFNEAFETLIQVEERCKELYFAEALQ